MTESHISDFSKGDGNAYNISCYVIIHNIYFDTSPGANTGAVHK